MVAADRRPHGVGEAAALSDFFEETRAHPPAEDSIEDGENIAVGVLAGEGGEADSKVALVDVAGLCLEPLFRQAGLERQERREGGARQRAHLLLHQRDHPVMVGVAGYAHDDILRHVPAGDVVEQVAGSDSLHTLFAAGDRPAEWLIAVDGAGEKLARPVSRLVMGATYLLLNDCPLPVDLDRVQQRTGDHVCQHVDSEIKALVRHLCPVAGQFPVGEGVQDAAGAFDGLGDGEGIGVGGAAFEQQVLHIVR